MAERRKPNSKGGFLVGTIAGIAAGVAGGTMLLRRSTASGDGPPAGARATAGAGDAVAARAGIGEQVQGLLKAVKQRWDQALRAGKEAADERAAELQLQLAQERREPVVVLDTKLDEAMGEIEPPKEGSAGAAEKSLQA